MSNYDACQDYINNHIAEMHKIRDNMRKQLDADASISAAFARKKTEEKIKEGCAYEIKNIRDKINDAVNCGKFFILGNGLLKTGTKDWLRMKGYEVRVDTQYNESYWTISWKNVN